MCSRRSPSIRLTSAKGIIVALIIALICYLSLYTWNLRTGVLDRLAGHTGLEFVGWVIKPGQWAVDKTTSLWSRYVHLVGVGAENQRLRQQVDDLTLELTRQAEDAREAIRLRRLLGFSPPQALRVEGARIVAQRMGPEAALETVLIDKGSVSGFGLNTPVITPKGLVGRILRAALTSSTVLLITDNNSRIPILGADNRTTGILTGRGPREDLEMRFVPQNAPLAPGELLLTSGLAGMFPKGLPAARVTSVERSEISLFLTVHAAPLVNLRDLEEVLLVWPSSAAPDPALDGANATQPDAKDQPAPPRALEGG